MDKLKVFVSDDSATVREHLITMALDLPEIAVVGQAQDVPGSLDAIRQTRPDVVILDIRMPGGNGLKVLRAVKKMNPAPRVIMMTNYAYAQYRKKCQEAGADFFLDKSTEFDKLPQALEQVRQDLRAVLAQTCDTLAQTSDALAQTSDALAQTSDALAQTSDALAETSDALAETSDALAQTSDALIPAEVDLAADLRVSKSNVQRRKP